jgi:hypothetical protein
LDCIASRQILAIILIGFLAFVGSAIVGKRLGIRIPLLHDEFSYLLAADTFASGRLTNPAHPMWIHFESFHILQQPTYMSKYPPAQGLILAAGKIVGGHPIWGVWISVALMCSAISWMLYAWVPPKWAFLGGFLTAINLNFGIVGYWSQTYYGGAVAASGGALFFGALRRMIQRQYIRDALIVGFGLAVLANSRPWEGMIACIPALVMLSLWIFGRKFLPFRTSIIRVILPLLFVLIITATAIGIYNHNVTGNAFRLPYSQYEETYSSVPTFIWQHPKPKLNFRHNAMQGFENNFSMKRYIEKKSNGFFLNTLMVVKYLRSLYFPGKLLIPILMIVIVLPYILKNLWMRLALLTVCFFAVLANSPISYPVFQHYLSPIASLAMFFVTQGLRCIYFLKLGRKSIGKILVLILLLISIKQCADTIDIIMFKEKTKGYLWSSKRAQIIKELKEMNGRHLIIVRYEYKQSKVYHEWVYNEADIDNAAVIWAREMDTNQNLRLLDYFKDRKIWLLTVKNEDTPPLLSPYASK